MIAAVVVPGPTSTGPSSSSRSTTCAAMLACADASAGAARALPPCTSRAATGTWSTRAGARDGARAQVGLVDVHHLGGRRPRHPSRSEVAGQLPRAARRDAEHGRVHFTPAGIPITGTLVAHGAHAPNRRAIAAGEQQQEVD